MEAASSSAAPSLPITQAAASKSTAQPKQRGENRGKAPPPFARRGKRRRGHSAQDISAGYITKQHLYINATTCMHHTQENFAGQAGARSASLEQAQLLASTCGATHGAKKPTQIVAVPKNWHRLAVSRCHAGSG